MITRIGFPGGCSYIEAHNGVFSCRQPRSLARGPYVPRPNKISAHFYVVPGQVNEHAQRRGDDSCWFCQPERRQRMTWSHTLLHCGDARLVEARRVAWEPEDKSPGGLKVLLSSPGGSAGPRALQDSGDGRRGEKGRSARLVDRVGSRGNGCG